MPQVAIVADDLTGALDTAAQWTRLGLRPIVCLSAQSGSQPAAPAAHAQGGPQSAIPAPLPDTPALAIHTASRAATAEQAYRRAKEAARRLRGRYVYKKVDSTLRGNIGAEIEGLLDGLGATDGATLGATDGATLGATDGATLGLQRALLAPSFPATGRTVQDGILHVNGVPLAQTEFQWSAHESHVPTLLAQQARRTVGHLPLEVVARGENAIRQALRTCAAQLVVADAVTAEHLHALARAAMHMPQPWLCCGSAGLAEGWLLALGLGQPPPRAELFGWEPQTGPVLVVAGSRHPATAAQLYQAQEQRGMQWIRLALDPGEDSAQWAQLTAPLRAQLTAPLWARAGQMLAEGRHVALATALSPYRPGNEAAVAAHLAHATAWICSRVRVLGLILTGGDTADAVCMALGMAGLEVVGEVQPGIPAANGIGGRGDGLRFVTKAGGFGDDYALVRSIDFIRGSHQPPDAPLTSV